MGETNRDGLDDLVAQMVDDANAAATRKADEEARRREGAESMRRWEAVVAETTKRVRAAGWPLVQKVVADLNASGAKFVAVAEPDKVGMNNYAHLGTILFDVPPNFKAPAARIAAHVSGRTAADGKMEPHVRTIALASVDVRKQNGDNYTEVASADGFGEDTLREMLRAALAHARGKKA